MPTPFTYVLSSGLHHGLEYMYYFMSKLADEAKRRGNAVTLTDGSAASNNRAISISDPAIFYGNGHGNPCAFTVECTELYMMVEGEDTVYIPGEGTVRFACAENFNTDIMKNRHCHLLSCLTARILGKALISTYGARSYIGYKEVFFYGAKTSEEVPDPEPGTPPTPEADFYSFLDSDTEGERKIMLEYSTVSEGVEAIKRKMQEYIYKYTEGEWKDWPIAHDVALLHEWNLDALTAYGDLSWRPALTLTTITLTSAISSFLSPFLFLVGLIGLATAPSPPKIEEKK